MIIFTSYKWATTQHAHSVPVRNPVSKNGSCLQFTKTALLGGFGFEECYPRISDCCLFLCRSHGGEIGASHKLSYRRSLCCWSTSSTPTATTTATAGSVSSRTGTKRGRRCDNYDYFTTASSITELRL